MEAPGEDRTHDLSLTKGTHYHYATEARCAQLESKTSICCSMFARRTHK